MESETKGLRLLRRAEVRRLTGLSTSRLYAMMSDRPGVSDPTFPRPVPLGGRSVAWVESEIAGWIKAQIAKRGSRPCGALVARPRPVPVLEEMEDALP